MINADVELIVLPYSSAEGRSLIHVLIDEFKSKEWTSFKAAVAFARTSANYVELIEAMTTFLEEENSIEMTFGADTFAPETKGSDYEAVKSLLENLGEYENFKLFLYHEGSRIFHPKMYFFSNEEKQKAKVIVGSSNWSASGLATNVEANVLIKLDMKNKEHKKFYKEIVELFETYWQETA